MTPHLTKISKILSHALRHAPADYGLTLDSEGWAAVSEVLSALQRRGLHATEATLQQIIEQSEKKRHQIKDGKIRAFYGHSIEEKIVKLPQEPPEILYHGTQTDTALLIHRNGLLPMSRQYVHLSIDVETATIVARRRKGEIVILKVKALEAHQNGVAFYREENGIWLSEPVPAKFIYE